MPHAAPWATPCRSPPSSWTAAPAPSSGPTSTGARGTSCAHVSGGGGAVTSPAGRPRQLHTWLHTWLRPTDLLSLHPLRRPLRPRQEQLPSRGWRRPGVPGGRRCVRGRAGEQGVGATRAGAGSAGRLPLVAVLLCSWAGRLPCRSHAAAMCVTFSSSAPYTSPAPQVGIISERGCDKLKPSERGRLQLGAARVPARLPSRSTAPAHPLRPVHPAAAPCRHLPEHRAFEGERRPAAAPTPPACAPAQLHHKHLPTPRPTTSVCVWQCLRAELDPRRRRGPQDQAHLHWRRPLLDLLQGPVGQLARGRGPLNAGRRCGTRGPPVVVLQARSAHARCTSRSPLAAPLPVGPQRAGGAEAAASLCRPGAPFAPCAARPPLASPLFSDPSLAHRPPILPVSKSLVVPQVRTHIRKYLEYKKLLSRRQRKA